MLVTLLKSKLHLARVTEANLDYEGSLMIDEDLMDLVRIHSYEKILVANIENGKRLETYAIPGKRGSGVIGLNGAAVYMGSKGDRIIIFAFCQVRREEIVNHRPLVAVLDEKNRPVGGLKVL